MKKIRHQTVVVVVAMVLFSGFPGCSDTSSSNLEVSAVTQDTSAVQFTGTSEVRGADDREISTETTYSEKNVATSTGISTGSDAEAYTSTAVSDNPECIVSEDTADKQNRISNAEIHYISGEIKFDIYDSQWLLPWNERWNKAISAEFFPLILIEEPSDIFIYPFISGYSLNLINEFGEVVYKTPIRVHGVHKIYDNNNSWGHVDFPSSTRLFDTWIVDPPEYVGYAVYKNGKELASLELSKHFPEVEVIEPETCQIIDGKEFEVSWIGTDLDNDTLVYSVQYWVSDKENGDGFHPLYFYYFGTEPVAGTSLTLNRRNIISGRLDTRADIYPRYMKFKVRVLVSDGTRSTYANSGRFLLSNAPSVEIERYAVGKTYETVTFNFEARVSGFRNPNYDPANIEEQFYLEERDFNFVWYSNLSGYLCNDAYYSLRHPENGNDIYTNLSSGIHTITVTAYDRYGNSASDEIELDVRNELTTLEIDKNLDPQSCVQPKPPGQSEVVIATTIPM